MNKPKLPPLGRLLNTIETLGYRVSHQYEDLIFVDNTAFLFRFNDNNETIHLHFNVDCDKDFSRELEEKATGIAKKEGIAKLSRSSDFKIEQEEGTEEVKIIFQ